MDNRLQFHEYRNFGRWAEQVYSGSCGTTYYTLRDPDGYPRATFRLYHLHDHMTGISDDVWTPAQSNGAVAHDPLDIIDLAAADLGRQPVPLTEYKYEHVHSSASAAAAA
jgi:hypothetical protein